MRTVKPMNQESCWTGLRKKSRGFGIIWVPGLRNPRRRRRSRTRFFLSLPLGQYAKLIIPEIVSGFEEYEVVGSLDFVCVMNASTTPLTAFVTTSSGTHRNYPVSAIRPITSSLPQTTCPDPKSCTRINVSPALCFSPSFTHDASGSTRVMRR